MTKGGLRGLCLVHQLLRNVVFFFWVSLTDGPGRPGKPLSPRCPGRPTIPRLPARPWGPEGPSGPWKRKEKNQTSNSRKKTTRVKIKTCIQCASNHAVSLKVRCALVIFQFSIYCPIDYLLCHIVHGLVFRAISHGIVGLYLAKLYHWRRG